MDQRQREERKFARVSTVCYRRLKTTPEYWAAVNRLKASGYQKRLIDLELERDVLKGRFVDFDRFCRRFEGWRGRVRHLID